ncbi:hypothetical protein [Apilactobacillus timberlakei]|uniref:hypothetical protein n=1 Tax=Apilactobacillus timberlakei TaxID=2008380 RepID=UPI00112C77CD|nr:hypothetical protein [Apilactobacillus timberlakei]TPR19229.1 hypothetical protein DYZ95_01020 [Apilactobacillus timberlakei]
MNKNICRNFLLSGLIMGLLIVSGNQLVSSSNKNHVEQNHQQKMLHSTKNYKRTIKLDNEKVTLKPSGYLTTNKHKKIALKKIIVNNPSNYSAQVSKKYMNTKFYKVTKHQKLRFSQSVSYYVNIYGKGFNQKGWVSSKYVHFNQKDAMKNAKKTPLYATHS